MAVVALKGTNITNLDSTPAVVNNVAFMGGRDRVQVGTKELTNGDSIGSTVIMARVPSNAVITSIKIFCDAITSGAADIGLYRTTQDGGAVVDADAYASAQSIASASVVGIECAFEARDIANIRQLVWADAGLSADVPGRFYDIVATLTAAAAASGTLSWIVKYAVD